jgi:hypothetical protein
VSAEPVIVYTLSLNEEERQELLRLLQQTLSDVRVERRRTEAHEYHEQVRHEENILVALTGKLRSLGR